MLAAILIAATIAGRYVARKGENPDNLWDMLIWIFDSGLYRGRDCTMCLFNLPGGRRESATTCQTPSRFCNFGAGVFIFLGALFLVRSPC